MLEIALRVRGFGTSVLWLRKKLSQTAINNGNMYKQYTCIASVSVGQGSGHSFVAPFAQGLKTQK